VHIISFSGISFKSNLLSVTESRRNNLVETESTPGTKSFTQNHIPFTKLPWEHIYNRTLKAVMVKPVLQ
jgi:hypothetical protein